MISPRILVFSEPVWQQVMPSNQKPIDLCVSIISGNNRQMTLECLESVVQSLSGNLSVEIHFVDNASPESWFRHLRENPNIIVRRNAIRKGFGRNHNEVMSSVDASFYLLLNDDTLVSPGFCETLVAEARLFPHAGFIGPKLLNGDRSLQRSCYRFPRWQLNLIHALFLHRLLPTVPLFDDYASFNHEVRRFVEFVSGAAILVRKEVIERVGVFDEQFFMYSEETEWCYRAHKAGWQTLYTPKTAIVHFGGQSSVSCTKERSVEFHRGHHKFLLKHFGPLGLIAFQLTAFLKHFPRLAIFTLTRKPAATIEAQTDAVLWSLGLLRRSGLKEIAEKQNSELQSVGSN